MRKKFRNFNSMVPNWKTVIEKHNNYEDEGIIYAVLDPGLKIQHVECISDLNCVPLEGVVEKSLF